MHSHAMGLSTLLKRSLPQPPVPHSTPAAAAGGGRSRTRPENPTSKREEDIRHSSSSSATREKSRAAAQPARKELDLTATDQQLLKSSL